jgi:hypothetical protein
MSVSRSGTSVGHVNLLCDHSHVDSTYGEKCGRDGNVVHELLGHEEPNGIPHPTSGLSEQAEGVKTNSDASHHRDQDGEMHSHIDPFEETESVGYT